jgi:bifunctional DNase/RNase
MISVDLVGIQVDPISGAAALVLREHDAPNRLLPIMVGQADASSVAIAASGNRFPRPLSHDIMAALVDALDGHLDAVEVTDLQEGTFLANLAVSGPSGQHRIDTRPSDAIALAVRLQAPLFVSEAVLDEAGAVPIELADGESDQLALEAAIDAEVDEFRSFLDDLDPADFIDTTATDTSDASGDASSNDGDGTSGASSDDGSGTTDDADDA